MHSKISCLVTLFFLRTCYSNPKLRVFPLYAKLGLFERFFLYRNTYIYTYIYIQILLNNLDLFFFHLTGVVGSAITYALIPKDRRGMLGALQPASDVEPVQAFFIELILTVILLFTVFSSTSDDNGRKDFGFANALAIGLAVTVAHLIGVSDFLYFFVDIIVL